MLVALLMAVILLLAGCSNQEPTASNEASIPSSSENDPKETDNPKDPTPPPTEDSVVSDDKPAMSTDPADYWVSDTEFDIIGYCEAYGLGSPNFITRGGDNVLSVSRMELVGGEQQVIQRVSMGEIWFEIWYYDWTNQVAKYFFGTVSGTVGEKMPAGAGRISYTGTDIKQYQSMIDFIIYTIPRLGDDAIDDPMFGFSTNHLISTCDMTPVDGKWEFGTLSAPVYVSE